MNITVKRFLILFSVCLNIGLLVAAGHAMVDRHFGDGPRFRSPYKQDLSAFENLGLNEEQSRKIRALVEQSIKESREDKKLILQELVLIMAKMQKPGPLDKKDLASHQKKMQELNIKKHEQRLRHMLEVREVLTPEQARQFYGNIVEHLNKRIDR